MIAAVCWVPKGIAKAVPEVVEPTEEEIEALRTEALNFTRDNEDSEDEESMEDEEEHEEVNPIENARAAAAALGSVVGASPGGQVGPPASDHLASELAELDMEHYDDEDDGSGKLQLFGNGGLGAAYYVSNEDDPYITLKEDEDEEEVDDFTIRPTDLLVLAARNEEDVSHLEVWVYEEGEDSNMYVHHDFMLSAFPLALAWSDFDVRSSSADAHGKCYLSHYRNYAIIPGNVISRGRKSSPGPEWVEDAAAAAAAGNFVAVGTMQPEIEIWDLDVVDEVEPVVMLGGSADQPSAADKKKKKKNKSKKSGRSKLKEGSHADAVLGLAWNRTFRNVLASASADRSVKVWDMAAQRCEHTLSHHSDKVQAVAWNPTEPTVLLSGSFDHTTGLADMRAPTHAALRWQLSADVECLAWDPHSPQCYVVSTEDGLVRCYDVRKGGSTTATPPAASSSAGGEALFTLHAHDKATCAVSFSPGVPNLMATASTDKLVKVWDISDQKPSCVATKNPQVRCHLDAGVTVGKVR
eukprot:jgi/Mesen1/8633/ME000050S08049